MKCQLNFCEYMKKGVGFLIFFSLNFTKTFLAPKQAPLADLLFLFPGLGALWGGGQSLPEVTSLLEFLDLKDYWVVTTSATPKVFCVA